MATQLDPGALILPNQPREWETIPPELLAALTPQVIDRVTDQWGKVHYFHPVRCFTPEQTRQIDAIARGRWFLLRNIWRQQCYNRKTGRGCRQIHDYFTFGCVERPFNGLTEIIGLLRQRSGHEVTFSGMALGDIEPITAEKARALMDAMAAKGYPL